MSFTSHPLKYTAKSTLWNKLWVKCSGNEGSTIKMFRKQINDLKENASKKKTEEFYFQEAGGFRILCEEVRWSRNVGIQVDVILERGRPQKKPRDVGGKGRYKPSGNRVEIEMFGTLRPRPFHPTFVKVLGYEEEEDFSPWSFMEVEDSSSPSHSKSVRTTSTQAFIKEHSRKIF